MTAPSWSEIYARAAFVEELFAPQRWIVGAPDGPWAEKEPIAEKTPVDFVEVFRVEHSRTGEGPYNSASALHDMAYAHCDAAHPNLWHDFEDPYSITRDHFFAFDSREALDSWFDGWHRQLAARGFVVTTYRVPADRVIHGRKQVVFERVAATPAGVQVLA